MFLCYCILCINKYTHFQTKIMSKSTRIQTKTAQNHILWGGTYFIAHNRRVSPLPSQDINQINSAASLIDV